MKNKGLLIIAVTLLTVNMLAIGCPVPVVEPVEVVPPAAPEVKEVAVIGTEMSFSPATITVRAGQQVKITFQNQGKVIHNLVIEGLGVSTRTIRPGQTDIIEFTAPAPGTYTFFCSVPGHRAAGMLGHLIVE